MPEKQPWTRQQRLEAAKFIINGYLASGRFWGLSEDDIIARAVRLTDKLLDKLEP